MPQMGALQVRRLQVGAIQPGIAQPGLPQAGRPEVGVAQVGPVQHSAVQAGAGQPRPDLLRPGQIGARERGAPQIRPQRRFLLALSALLDRLDAAATSIDATLYDFNRVSVREALIAAHNRAVAVRVVTDDGAYADPDYAPHFQALEGAGIPVVNDMRASIMHNKFFVIDGQVVWTGSTNLTFSIVFFTHDELRDAFLEPAGAGMTIHGVP